MHKYTARLSFGTLIAMMAVLLVFASCKKRKAFNAEDGQSLVDVTDIRSQTDLVLADANDMIANQFFLRGKSASESAANGTICGMSMDSSLIYTGKIILNYGGSVCSNLKREGQVIVNIQNYPTKKWKDKGAVLEFTFVNYFVTNALDNRNVKINGTMLVTNVSGGTWYELKYLNQSSLVQNVSAENLDLVFDKIGFVTASMERRVTFTMQNNTITGTDEGTATQGNDSNVDCWGSDRNEKNFTALITTPVIWDVNCNPSRPKSGEALIRVSEKYFDLKGVYGTDADGKLYGGNGCAYGWQVSWSLRNSTKHRVFSY